MKAFQIYYVQIMLSALGGLRVSDLYWVKHRYLLIRIVNSFVEFVRRRDACPTGTREGSTLAVCSLLCRLCVVLYS